MTARRHIIISACEWLNWTLALVILTFFWAKTIVFFETRQNNDGGAEMVAFLCTRKYDCWHHSSQSDLALVWNFSKLEYVCGVSPQQVATLGGLLTCGGFLEFESTIVLTQLALAGALHSLFIFCFQGLTWLLYKAARVLWLILCVAVAVAIFVVFCVMNFVNVPARASFLMAVVCLGFPMMALCSAVVSRELIAIRNDSMRLYAEFVDVQPIATLPEDDVAETWLRMQAETMDTHLFSEGAATSGGATGDKRWRDKLQSVRGAARLRYKAARSKNGE